MNTTHATASRKQAMMVYFDRRALIMLFLGFSAGIPLMLIFSSLSLWLAEAGVERKAITTFSWAALGYSFRFVWSPLIDSLSLPILSRRLGRRRGWLLLAQSMIVVAIVLMSLVNPAHPETLNMMALGAVLLGFSAATQDVVIDAYRIESAPNDSAMQSVMSSTYVTGYRLAMITSGAGALWLASFWGSTKEHYFYEAWQHTYWVMAGLMGVGILTTLYIREPKVNANKNQCFSTWDNVRLVLMFVMAVMAFVATFVQLGRLLPSSPQPLLAFGWESIRLLGSILVGGLVGWLSICLGVVSGQVAYQTWIEPLLDFFKRYGKQAILLLVLIGLYRISDIVAGVISNVFYTDLGFSKEQIALAVKTFGMILSILGGLAGGMLAQRLPIMKMMMLGAVLSSLTNLLFIVLIQYNQLQVLYVVVGFDNFAAGLASTVFVAFLSALTNIRFSAVQYALFSSLMTLFPKVLGGYSGAMVDKMGYEGFFTLTALLGVPILVLVWWANKQFFCSSSE